LQISGRRRFNIISPELEAKLGASSADEVMQQFKGRILPSNDPRVQQIRRVLGRLAPYAEQAGLRDVEWEVHVIDSPQVNAFVTPRCVVLAGVTKFGLILTL